MSVSTRFRRILIERALRVLWSVTHAAQWVVWLCARVECRIDPEHDVALDVFARWSEEQRAERA